jgi:hypothetical protein
VLNIAIIADYLAWPSKRVSHLITTHPSIVRYRREPIMLLYSLWSTASPSLSGPSDVAVLIRVDTGLSSAMLNFFITSFVYLA